uniref:NadR/Ttd14 AAA domain-containing protein n=1 Tax=Clastoptera arizonana TaxID=38151 RepID=A0A1B6CPY0_9HEMI
MFKDRESVINFFRLQRFTSPNEIEELFAVYEECLRGPDVFPPITVKTPFIVIEGVSMSQRIAVTSHLVPMLNSEYYENPPTCMRRCTLNGERDSMVRQAFNLLGLYVAEFQTKKFLANGYTVVMNGYWTEQASNYIRRMGNEINPILPRGHVVYKSPPDLMMPDVVVYLDTRHQPNRTGEHGGLKREIYERFEYSPIIMVTPSEDLVKTSKKIKKIILKVLNKKYSFSQLEI